ncbi:hypothetical protein F4777DRAFT_565450 [Nemania sp. FL0916]|nr:hypothetical protein F4777DRAFT_565450 [Nemania sp. FL0916]
MGSAAADFKGYTAPRQSDDGHQNPIGAPFGGLYNDPRTSSTQSLTPSLPEYEEIERRKLLVIYIHGFMGNDTSFQSFPAHVHQYLKLALLDSHVVHSKVYPRYKTYKSIDVARDNFSSWLEPLESPKTDVVLVGHSMGGLLAADIVLKPPAYQQQHHGYFEHRILGTVNLDAPLLGMHPGIIVSGISSLFRKNEVPKVPGEPSTQSILSPSTTGLPSPTLSTYSVPSTISQALPPSPPPPPAPFMRPAFTNDPNFNPNFVNDVRIEERTWWKNVVHFVKKHNSEGLIDATANHIMSHLEFGGSMFDLNALKSRYENVRKLEDIDDLKQAGPHVPPQVRFIQYYTICNGFPKKPKQEDPRQGELSSAPTHDGFEKGLPLQHVSLDGADVEPEKESFEGPDFLSSPNSERPSLEILSPDPIPDELPLGAGDTPIETKATSSIMANEDGLHTIQGNIHEHTPPPAYEPQIEDKVLTSDMIRAVATLDFDLPPLPELPPAPEPIDLDKYTDKDARKVAEKEAKRAQKAYAQAVKDREKAIKDREKIIEKRKKKQAQDAEKKAKEEKKRRKKEDSVATASTASPATRTEAESTFTQEVSKQLSGLSSDPLQSPAPEWTPMPDEKEKSKGKDKDKEKEKRKGSSSRKDTAEKEEKKKKQRKFCNVPKTHGQVDPRWVGVFMKDMDEVAAHTGLFFAGEHYESLVGDVGNTIVEWVHADLTKRTILGLQ